MSIGPPLQLSMMKVQTQIAAPLASTWSGTQCQVDSRERLGHCDFHQPRLMDLMKLRILTQNKYHNEVIDLSCPSSHIE